MSVFKGFDPAVFSQAGVRCAPSQRTFIIVGVVLLVVLAMMIAGALIGWDRYKQSDYVFLKDLKERDGIARSSEVNKYSGPKSLRKKAKSIRPGMKSPKLADVGAPLGVAAGVKVWQSMEDSVVVFGPPRSGKGFYYVVNRILDSPGAVITTSTRGDNVAMTLKGREALGDCIIFDPQGLSGLKSTLKWTPYRGCESAKVAAVRADTLIAASGIGNSTGNAEWADASKNILMYLLQAGALAQVSVSTFAGWGQNPEQAKKAARILSEDPRATVGWGAALEGIIKEDPRTRGSKWMGVQNATSALSIPEVAEALNPGPGDEVIDPVKFISGSNTLYLLGSKSGGAAIAPFLVALMDEIVDTAREVAFTLPGNRLDPPLSLVLDEIGNMAPWKALPQIMADGGGIGVSPFVIFQSPAQARGQWGEQQAQALVDSAIIQIQLGGSSNSQELERLKSLAGQREMERFSETSSSGSGLGGSSSQNRSVEKVDVITVAELRRIPPGYAFVLPRNGRPLVMKAQRWIDRKDAKQIRESKKAFEERMKTSRAAVDVEGAPLLRSAGDGSDVFV